MCFTYVIEIIILCLCSFDFWSVAIKFVRFHVSCRCLITLTVLSQCSEKEMSWYPFFFIKRILDFCEAIGSVLETFLFLNSLLADDIRPSGKDVKVKAVCQSLTNLLRGTTYGLRVSASFLRSAPGPGAWITGSARRSVRWRRSDIWIAGVPPNPI